MCKSIMVIIRLLVGLIHYSYGVSFISHNMNQVGSLIQKQDPLPLLSNFICMGVLNIEII